MKVVISKNVPGKIKSLVNPRGLSFECTIVLHEGILFFIFLFFVMLCFCTGAINVKV